ncbi:hypothetical protein J2TS4_13310 [Paenibacillus sp. J2TS4]|nr:hypothetical protein J2TS4_13310 [Paenibacillus sp. J2TS4]
MKRWTNLKEPYCRRQEAESMEQTKQDVTRARSVGQTPGRRIGGLTLLPIYMIKEGGYRDVLQSLDCRQQSDMDSARRYIAAYGLQQGVFHDGAGTGSGECTHGANFR